MGLENTRDELLLKQINTLEREVERLKRNLLHNLTARTGRKKAKPSLFGSVRSGDIADEEIQKAKTALFRDLEDL
ncbi:MAG: hypothetical protein AB1426_06180 [Bacillota bacterium]